MTVCFMVELDYYREKSNFSEGSAAVQFTTFKLLQTNTGADLKLYCTYWVSSPTLESNISMNLSITAGTFIKHLALLL